MEAPIAEAEDDSLQQALIPAVTSSAESSVTLETPSTSVTRALVDECTKDTETRRSSTQTALDSSTSVENKQLWAPALQSDSFDNPSRASQINIEMDAIGTLELNQQNRAEIESRCLSTSVLSTISDGAICRICHEGEEMEDLLSPCHCTGTVGLLHLSCLEKWLGSSSRTRCELCGFEYTVDSHPKPFLEWLRNPASHSDRRNLICDVCCFFLLTPLASISSWLCLVGAQYYSFWTGRWEVPGLISLTVFLISIYLTWCLVVIRYHYRIWMYWRRHNQIVRIRAVKRGNISSRNQSQPSGNNLQSSEGSTSRGSPVRDSQTEDNNNNNAVSIDEDEDVVVEVSGRLGRDSYRLLSESNNLVCSPNKPCHKRQGSLSPSTKVQSVHCSPGRTKPRSYSASSADGEITAPLLGQRSHCIEDKPPRIGKHSVNRSLMSDPTFSDPPPVSFHSTMVTYQNLNDDVFTTAVKPVSVIKKVYRLKESYV